MIFTREPCLEKLDVLHQPVRLMSLMVTLSLPPLQALINTSAEYGPKESFDFQLVKGVVVIIDPISDDDDYV